MKRKAHLAPVKPIRPTPLRGDSVKSLDDIVAEVHAGTVTAFAIVAKSDGYSSWYATSHKTLSDTLNLIGQLESLKQWLVEQTNKD